MTTTCQPDDRQVSGLDIDIDLGLGIDLDINNTLGQTTIENDSNRNTLFDTFWNEYPKKVGKQKCLNWFMNKSRNVTNELVNKMIESLKVWKKSDQWKDEQYIPNPYTWLNRGGWDDELPKQKNTFSSYSKTPIQWEEAPELTDEDRKRIDEEIRKRKKKG